MSSKSELLEIKRLYLEEKLSLQTIADRYGVYYTTIKSRLQEQGITIRGGGVHNRIDFSPKEVEEIVSLYLEKKWSVEKIEKKFGVSQKPITRVLTENGVSIRSRGEWAKGKKRSRGAKKRLSRFWKEKWQETDYREKTMEAMRGRKLSKEQIQEMSKRQKGKKLSRKTVKKILKSREWYRHSEETKKKISKGNKGKKLSEETKKKIGEIQSALWQSPKHQKKMAKALSLRPTSIEKRLIKIIKKYDLPFRYVGDYSFWIKGFNPDFVHSGGEKIVIEANGDYWHNHKIFPKKGETDKRKKEVYARNGYKLIEFWGSEIRTLAEEEIVQKIQSFSCS